MNQICTLAPVAAAGTLKLERPDHEWVTRTCPGCGEEGIVNYYWQGGRGCVDLKACWAALGEHPTYREPVQR